MKCAYAGKSTISPCVGPVAVTMHDIRGCREVCYAHAKWLIDGASVMVGHSRDCMRGAVDAARKEFES